MRVYHPPWITSVSLPPSLPPILFAFHRIPQASPCHPIPATPLPATPLPATSPGDFYPHRSTAATGAPAAAGASAEPRPWLRYAPGARPLCPTPVRICSPLNYPPPRARVPDPSSSAACAWAAPFALGAVVGAVACSLLLLPLALAPLDAQGGDEELLLQSHADTWQEGQGAWQGGAAASWEQPVVPHPPATAASGALPLAPLAALDSGGAAASGGGAGESDGDTEGAEVWAGDAAMRHLQGRWVSRKAGGCHARQVGVTQGRHPAVRALVEANGQLMRQQRQAVAVAEEDERGMHAVLTAALQELERERLMPHGTVSLVQPESMAALAEAVRARQGEASKAGAEGQAAGAAAGALQTAEHALLGAVAAGGGPTADLPSLVSQAQAAGRVGGRMGHGAAGASAGEGQGKVAADGEIWGGGGEGMRRCMVLQCAVERQQRAVAAGALRVPTHRAGWAGLGDDRGKPRVAEGRLACACGSGGMCVWQWWHVRVAVVACACGSGGMCVWQWWHVRVAVVACACGSGGMCVWQWWHVRVAVVACACGSGGMCVWHVRVAVVACACAVVACACGSGGMCVWQWWHVRVAVVACACGSGGMCVWQWWHVRVAVVACACGSGGMCVWQWWHVRVAVVACACGSGGMCVWQWWHVRVAVVACACGSGGMCVWQWWHVRVAVVACACGSGGMCVWQWWHVRVAVVACACGSGGMCVWQWWHVRVAVVACACGSGGMCVWQWWHVRVAVVACACGSGGMCVWQWWHVRVAVVACACGSGGMCVWQWWHVRVAVVACACGSGGMCVWQWWHVRVAVVACACGSGGMCVWQWWHVRVAVVACACGSGGMCVWQWWHDRHACMQHVLSRARVEAEQRAGKAWAVLQRQQQWGEGEGAGSVAGEAVRAGTVVTVGDVEANLTASPSDAPHVDSFHRLLLYLRPLASLFSLPLAALLSPNATHPLAPRLQSLIDATSARLQAASASLAAAQSALEWSERRLWLRCGVKAGGTVWEERHDSELQRYRAVAGAAFDKWCVAWGEARPSHRLTAALAAPPHIWWRGGLWDGEQGAAGVEGGAASKRGGGVNAGSAAGEGERDAPEISFLLLADPGAAQPAVAAVAPEQVVQRLHACASTLPRMQPAAAAATSPPNPTPDDETSPSAPRMGPPLAELLLLLPPDSTHAGQQGDEQGEGKPSDEQWGEGQQAGGVEAWQAAGRSIDPQLMLVLPLVAPHAHGAATEVSGAEGGGGEAAEGGARAVGMAPMAEWEGFELLARAATGRLLLLLTWRDLPAVMHGEGEEGCKWVEQLTAGMAEDGRMGVVGVRTSRVERGVGRAEEEGEGRQGELEGEVGGGAVVAAMAQWGVVGKEGKDGAGLSGSGDAGKGAAGGREEAGRRLTGYVDGTPLLVRRHALMTLGGLGLAPGAPAAGAAAAVAGWALCTRMWLAGFRSKPGIRCYQD
ncbi:unnamed protein product [Closterium sp. NIES-64]|nr:unnamed protein product [Closterium sp. NIES-64]